MISWPKGHYYIGSSVDLDRRWKQHRSYLRLDKHCNPHMQAVFNKYGPGRFEVLELCPPEDVQDIEQEHLDREFSEGSELLLNIMREAGGGNYGEEWRKNNAAANRKKAADPEHIKTHTAATRRACAKPFRVTFPDGRVEEWPSIPEASELYGICYASVSRYLNGKRIPGNHLRGCKFEYI